VQVAFEEGAGVLEVLFGVGFGGGDAVKRFVEDAGDALLFRERGNWNFHPFDEANIQISNCAPCR
jgi:hypothetical protein